MKKENELTIHHIFWYFLIFSILGLLIETIYSKFNLNGRVCIQYSIYWGILSVILMKFIKPIIDYLVNKMQIKIRNIIEIILFIFLVINCMFTVWGIQTYENRVLGKEKAYNNVNNFILQIKENIEENYFTNDRMSRTFPNLRIKDENENEIWIKALINKEESK